MLNDKSRNVERSESIYARKVEREIEQKETLTRK